MIALGAAGLTLIWCLLHWWQNGDCFLSPDGTYYLKAAQGQAVPAPYNGRRLWCQTLRTRKETWIIVTIIGLVSSSIVLTLISPAHPWLAVVGFLGCYGLVGLNVRFPILVDAFAFYLALLAFMLWPHWYAVYSLGLAAVVHQRAGIFAALWAHSWPMLLLAIGFVLIVHALTHVHQAAPDQVWLKHPIREARKSQRLFDPLAMLLPWGSFALLLPFVTWSPWLVLTLVVAYGQLFIAQDRARLYQWAFPALLPALALIPAPLVGAWMLVHLLNPYRGV